MAGYPFLADASYAASVGYAMPSAYGGEHEGPSHTSFIVWLIVFAVLSAFILGGLKVGGFSFVFRTR